MMLTKTHLRHSKLRSFFSGGGGGGGGGGLPNKIVIIVRP